MMQIEAIRAVLDKAGTGAAVSDELAKAALTEAIALVVALLGNIERIAAAAEAIAMNTHPIAVNHDYLARSHD